MWWPKHSRFPLPPTLGTWVKQKVGNDSLKSYGALCRGWKVKFCIWVIQYYNNDGAEFVCQAVLHFLPWWLWHGLLYITIQTHQHCKECFHSTPPCFLTIWLCSWKFPWKKWKSQVYVTGDSTSWLRTQQTKKNITVRWGCLRARQQNRTRRIIGGNSSIYPSSQPSEAWKIPLEELLEEFLFEKY